MDHITNAGVVEAIHGSCNFTVGGLGLGGGNNNIELNLEVDSNRDQRDVKVWNDELWNAPHHAHLQLTPDGERKLIAAGIAPGAQFQRPFQRDGLVFQIAISSAES